MSSFPEENRHIKMEVDLPKKMLAVVVHGKGKTQHAGTVGDLVLQRTTDTRRLMFPSLDLWKCLSRYFSPEMMGRER